jgi:hypothetical protein
MVFFSLIRNIFEGFKCTRTGVCERGEGVRERVRVREKEREGGGEREWRR